MTLASPDMRARARDYVALSKPGIVRMCVLMAAGGMWLAPGGKSWAAWAACIGGTALTVACANALNMALERDSDRLMQRTRQRPLAAGRMGLGEAWCFAIICGIAGTSWLFAQAGAIAGSLAIFAIVSYAAIYTPLKRLTPMALLIGAFPGAVPPLLGWAAATQRIDAPGLILSAILLVWQMPHFLAIALFRKEDYGRAGIRVVPLVRGDRVAKLQAVAWAAILLPTSLTLTLMGITGLVYLVAASVLGLGLLGWSVLGLWSAEADAIWARRLFFASLVYLPGLLLALILDLSL